MKDKKNLLILLLLLLLLGGGYYYFTESKTPEHVPATVKEVPPASGVTLSIPNTDVHGNPRCAPQYDGSAVDDGVASKKYQPIDCDPVDILHIPIDGPCPVDPNGVIGAPSDWTHGCSHATDEGGIAYLGHSVRGPRLGAFERIHELQVGQLVEVEDKVYAVASVSQFPTNALPHRLWTEGHFSLITCRIDAKADAGGEITTDTVVELTDKL